MANSTEEFTHFVSIDFGTAGCAIAISKQGKSKSVFKVLSWEGMEKGADAKRPTVLLLDRSQNLLKFGTKAIEAYLATESDDDLLFTKFKMHLYNNPGDKYVRAMNGQNVPIINVFVHSLQYIKKCATDALKTDFLHLPKRIQWIITVPAIWTPATKQFMRIAASKAGFYDDSFILALEPEAAALYCLHDMIKAKKNFDSSYLVVDCGCGTIDITAHKIQTDVKGEIIIEELSPPNGGNYGGLTVNRQFEKMLQTIFSLSDIQFELLRNKFPKEWMKMVWVEFEHFKCRIKPDEDICIPIHKNIIEEVHKLTGKSIEDLVDLYTEEIIEWDLDEGGIVLPYRTVSSLYKPTLTNIISLINTVLSNPNCKSVTTVHLVGGFALSGLLFDEIKKFVLKTNALTEVTVKQHADAMLAVVKGAVIFGQNKEIIKCRVLKKSVGVETNTLFIDGTHDKKYLKEINDRKYCEKVFHTLVKANQLTYIGKPAKFRFHPLTNEQQVCIVSLYESPKENVRYIDEEGCKLMCKGKITVPKYSSYLPREIELLVDFTKTECDVSAYSISGTNTRKLKVQHTFLN